ncbi:M60 family metallopeptidase [Pinibacter aurantiacus]|uniref:M60 family metallopeptidase n=1 Tax=Pinibacter aurantiacus TaxID=2851599 RepID=A0A9E2SF16_9BACT|nr:M60 family metallopeptidase [Pinibacter aurantiacus]MBV4359909.1 M60 family metallopeptidase [Pinibacter aurantiacus]
MMRPILMSLLLTGMLLGMISCQKNQVISYPDGWSKGSDSGGHQSVDTSIFVIDKSMYSKARVFPGMVDPTERRVMDTTISINATFQDAGLFNQYLRISVQPQPQFSTGLWAPAGELIIIDVPADGMGLSLQIGAHTDNLTGMADLVRDPIIVSQTTLNPGRNYARNPYGGTIYVRASRSLGKIINLTFSGACAQPDFILGTTTDEAAWAAQVKRSTVPWLELRSNNFIFTLPRDKFDQFPLTNPIALMQTWDDIVNKDYYGWMGLSDTAMNDVDKAPGLPWRAVQDIQLTAGYGHSSYPIVLQNDNNWFTGITNLNTILASGNWGVLHELGHNCQMGTVWSLSSLGETSNNLFSFKYAHRKGASHASMAKLHPALPGTTGAFATGLAYAATSGFKNFNVDAAINDPFRRILPFVQLFEKTTPKGGGDGYNLMNYWYQQGRRIQRLNFDDQSKMDFIVENACDYTGQNLEKFFFQWGINVSSLATSRIRAKYPLPATVKDLWTYNPIIDTGGTRTVSGNLYVSKTAWVVNSKSSDDGSNTAAKAIDGNTGTYWQTQWSSNPAGTTHFVVIDMGATYTISGVSLNMDASRYFDYCNVYASKTTTFSGTPTYQTTSLARNNTEQVMTFASPVTCRYLKIEIPRTSGHIYTDASNTIRISEISAIY